MLQNIIANVLTALYQPFWFALLLSVLAMQVYKQNPDLKKAARDWLGWFKTEPAFRRLFLLIFYTVMILFRTLLNRSMWANPVSNVIGVWGFFKPNGDFTTEAVENLILFLPFSFLLLWSFREKLLPKVTLRRALGVSAKYSFLFSLSIEMAQLFLRLGTWQLSDLAQNTLGGVMGGMLFWTVYRIKHKK